ncbi:hypothetical protein [Oryzibacter oryziterrae]|uniref:hypothetical protein n=1 Tax=Oryzibacter oryziterrae TaxID=2766474 RepID=UPI001F19E1AE|nr:hypothetical protein [Oryzibacter oryziterrae]
MKLIPTVVAVSSIMWPLYASAQPGANSEGAAPQATPTILHHLGGFTQVALPIDASTKTIYSFKFLPKKTGLAVVNGRGFCSQLMWKTSERKEIDLELRKSADTPFASDARYWGVATGDAKDDTGGNYWTNRSWTALKEFSVTQGKTYTVVLSAQEVGSTSDASSCTGTVTVDIQ